MQIKLPESATLCLRCTPYFLLLIDISAASKPAKAHDEWWNSTFNKVSLSIQGLGPNDCELCHILNKAFSKVAGFDKDNTKISVSAHGFSKYKDLEHGTCMFTACGVKLALAPFMPVVTADDGEVINAFTGRPVVQLFNPLLAKIWLTKCHSQHAACKPIHSSRDFDFPFRVIDVQEGRLVDAPPGARYVALSYVWGSIKQVMLKKTNKTFLELPGSITSSGLAEATGEHTHIKEEMQSEGRAIPRTIREAIHLCQMISERYLWTDSLCVLQDDEIQLPNGAWTNPDKLLQIPNMDLIYGASTLTVIAACGADSNAGLPGVHPSPTRSAQTIGKIGDQMFVSIEDGPMDAFWQSIWTSRAWTFQEFLLSKRHLIFLPSQVIFHCSTLAWSEDHALEYIDDPHAHVSSVPAWTKSWQLRPLKLPQRSTWSDDVFFPAIFINDFYSDWLRNFLKRRLTVPSDILFAFAGALSASRGLLGTFHHGLPVDYFCEALNWWIHSRYWGATPPPYHGLQRRRPGFPSWSWTGWMWDDLPPHEEFGLNYQTRSSSNWARIAIWGVKTSTSSPDTPSLFQISAPDVQAWERLHAFPPGAFHVPKPSTPPILPDHLPPLTTLPIPQNTLILKTVSSTLHISPYPLHPSSTHVRVFPTADFTSSTPLGGIGLPPTWREKVDAGLAMQILAVGHFFRGPDSKFPQNTDEDDPTVKCLVVRDVGEGVVERVSVFDARVGVLRGLAWREVVAVLR